MKSQSLEQGIIKSARIGRGQIILPGGTTKRNWPLCMTCGRDVEAAEIKNVNSKSCEIWARCHGSEDFIKVTWDIPVRDLAKDPLEDTNVGWAVRRAMSDFAPFDPTHVFDVGSRKS